MKSIKIDQKNAEAIESELEKVNGRASRHAYTTFGEIKALADYAEKRVLALLPKKDAKGAFWVETSGGVVPNKYRGSREATTVLLERRSSGWYLNFIKKTTVFNQGGGNGELTLTAAQAEIATERFKRGFRVARVAG